MDFAVATLRPSGGAPRESPVTCMNLRGPPPGHYWTCEGLLVRSNCPGVSYKTVSAIATNNGTSRITSSSAPCSEYDRTMTPPAASPMSRRRRSRPPGRPGPRRSRDSSLFIRCPSGDGPGAVRDRVGPGRGARFQRHACSDIRCRPRLCRAPGGGVEPYKQFLGALRASDATIGRHQQATSRLHSQAKYLPLCLPTSAAVSAQRSTFTPRQICR